MEKGIDKQIDNLIMEALRLDRAYLNTHCIEAISVMPEITGAKNKLSAIVEKTISGEEVDYAQYDTYEDVRIGHREDALALLDEMIEDCAVLLSYDAQRLYKPRLEALYDAIERGIT